MLKLLLFSPLSARSSLCYHHGHQGLAASTGGDASDTEVEPGLTRLYSRAKQPQSHQACAIHHVVIKGWLP